MNTTIKRTITTIVMALCIAICVGEVFSQDGVGGLEASSGPTILPPLLKDGSSPTVNPPSESGNNDSVGVVPNRDNDSVGVLPWEPTTVAFPFELTVDDVPLGTHLLILTDGVWMVQLFGVVMPIEDVPSEIVAGTVVGTCGSWTQWVAPPDAFGGGPSGITTDMYVYGIGDSMSAAVDHYKANIEALQEQGWTMVGGGNCP